MTTPLTETRDKSFQTYIPVHPIGEGHQATDLLLNLDYDKARKRIYLSCSPVDRAGQFESIVLTAMQFANIEPLPRYNAKTMRKVAVVIDGQLRSRDLEYDPAWKLVVKVLADNNLALTTPATGKTRDEVINAILAASRQPCPEVIERFWLLGTDGNYYHEFPAHVRMAEPVQRQSKGFVYRLPDGTTCGTLGAFPSANALREDWELSQDRKALHFREALDAMTDSKIESQAVYWIKDEPSVASTPVHGCSGV